MDYLNKIMLPALMLTLAFALPFASAQPDIDANRMNRDINIMENILQEMFKTQIEGSHDNLRIHSIGSFHFGQNDIRGTYLPGYGVIFNVSSGSRPFVLFQDDENRFSYRFQYGDDENGEKVTKESVANRIIEFLRDYGSTLGQLSDDHKIMVIYNPDTHKAPRIDYFRLSDDKEKTEQQQLPTISVVASMRDLKAYRSGSIDEGELTERVEISMTDAPNSSQKDLKIMADILQSAFKESEEKSFRVSGSVDYLKLDNFGAFFSFDARYSSNAFELIDRIRSIEIIDGEKVKGNVLSDDKDKSQRIKVRNIDDSTKTATFSKKQEQTKEEILKAYDQFLSDLKEYMVDYGRTLRSVESNQHILVSVNVHSRYKDIPERIDLQIQKSTLESMDRGDMSREKVIDQIQMREY